MDIETAESVPENESSPETKSPRGLARRVATEIRAAKDALRTSREQGRKAVRRFLAEQDDQGGRKSKLNLFHSDVVTLRALLLGKLPQTDAERRHQNADDDEARVGADVLTRTLDAEVDSTDDGYVAALKYAIEDWTLPGVGVARVLYEMGEEEVEPGRPAITAPCQCGGMPECQACQGAGTRELAPEVPATARRPNEEAEAEYVYWEDFIYGPCRTWQKCPWVAFGSPMRERAFVKRFGKKAWRDAPKRSSSPGESQSDALKSVWSEVYVWEFWDKEEREVYWYVEGMDRLLDRKPDPLGLKGFFPCPRPLFANTSTTKCVPKPDLEMAKDLYDEIDELTARIAALQRAAKVIGIFDATQEEIPRLIEEARENELIPVKSMMSLIEKGGIEALIAWFPIEKIVAAIQVLTEQRSVKIAALHQVNGMSDIVRGQAEQRATATEQKIKAGFASTRIQTSQDEVARFASDLQKLRAEVIATKFDSETIKERSGVLRTKDAEKADAAIALLQSDIHGWRVQIRPESISLPDMAQQKQQRTEILAALGAYFQSMLPFLQMAGAKGPEATAAALEFVLDGGRWLVSGMRGSSEIESAFDRFAAAAQKIAQQPPPPPPPDPTIEAKKMEAQAKVGEAKAKMQQTAMDAQVAQAEHRMNLESLAAEVQADRVKAETRVAAAQAMPPRQPGGVA